MDKKLLKQVLMIIALFIILVSVGLLIEKKANIEIDNQETNNEEKIDIEDNDDKEIEELSKEETNKEEVNKEKEKEDNKETKTEEKEEEKKEEEVKKEENTSNDKVSISVSEDNVSIYTNDSYKIKVSVTPSGEKLTYKSSDKSILTVDDNGNVKAKLSGNASVTISTSTGISTKVSFKVISRERIYFISHAESDGTNHITGDAILLESNGHYAMVDAGNTNVADRVVNYLKNNDVKNLDFILFTHMDADHAGNLQSLLEAGISINNIYVKNYNVNSYNTSSDSEVQKALSRYNRIKYLAEESKYKNLVDNIKIVSSADEGTSYNFKYLKFKMTLYNNKRNVNIEKSENYNSIVSLIEVNNHRVLLTGDAYDTKQFNEMAKSVGKVDILKVPHHGSVKCALIEKKYDGKYQDKNGTLVESVALDYLKPKHYIITSSEKKISIIRSEKDADTKMCVDVLPSNASKYFVDVNKNALVVDLTNSDISIKGN